jgi:hypothetical protein
LTNTARWPSGAVSPGVVTFKLQPFVLGKELPLADCGDPWAVTMVGRAKPPWAPHGLTAEYSGAGIVLNWEIGVIAPPPTGIDINRWWVQLRLPEGDDAYPPEDAGPPSATRGTPTPRL